MNNLSASTALSVQRAFDRAAHRYYQECYGAENDSLQKQTAQILISALNQQRNEQKTDHFVDHLVDLGCGMGVHWPVLKPLANHYTGIDLAPQMIQEALKHQPPTEGTATTSWLVGDAQALPLANTSVDVVFSNLALQWCNHRQLVANELYRVCKKDGNIYLSTLLSGSLIELHRLKSLGLLRAVNKYPTAKEWYEPLERAGFTALEIKKITVTTYHKTGSELLRSMKGIGASQVIVSNDVVNSTLSAPPQGLRTPQWLKQVDIALEPYRQHQGIPLTYQVALVQARK